MYVHRSWQCLVLAPILLLILSTSQSSAQVQSPGALHCSRANTVCDFPFTLPAPGRFVVVSIEGEVSLGMSAYVKRVTQSLIPGDILILDMNTFGGRIDAAVIIRDALLQVDAEKIRTVAYIHRRALSAGALIALATDIIVVAPGSSIGAATPVQISEDGMEPVEKKIVSYMRAEMRSTAKARGRNGDIAEAMVDASLFIEGLNKKGALLTLDGNQSLEWGIASFEAENIAQLIAHLGYSSNSGAEKTFSLHWKKWSWAERLGDRFTSTALSGLLMSIGMLALMIGLYTGGSPLPFVLSGVCLTLFFFGHYVVHLAGLEEILCFVLGVLLLLVELFTPGYIIPGALGLLLIIASLGLGLVNVDHVPLSVQWEAGWLSSALARLSTSFLVTIGLGSALIRFLPNTKLGNMMILKTQIYSKANHAKKMQRELIGGIGTTTTVLRPAGRIAIQGKNYDALCETGYLKSGQRIQVRAVKGFSLLVTPLHTKHATEAKTLFKEPI